ncbi:hypothetical protein Tco_0242918 [Tanacetum coccineum]
MGGATPGVMKFCEWLKNNFKKFNELDYDVLVKLEECWWKVNAHEKAPFAQLENHGQGPFANAKTKKDYDPYLDINRIFGRDYGSNNAGNIQDNMREYHNPSICKFRRFEMMKYAFDANDEYVAIKEREHSRTDIDSCQAYRELFCIMDEGWNANLVIMEYLVKISKKARILELKRRHLKIIVLTSNTPYPSRKIRRICACTSQDHEGTRSNMSYPEKIYTPYSSYGNKIFWKMSNVVPTPRNPQYDVSKSFKTPY